MKKMFNLSRFLPSLTQQFYLNRKNVKKTLISMLFSEEQINEYVEMLFSDNELRNLKYIYNFLEKYNGEAIVDDFKNFFIKLGKTSFSIDFYVYFLKMYVYRYENTDNVLKNNISSLFYELEVEEKFNKEKFRRHFKKYYLNELSLDKSLDSELVEYIKANINTEVLSDLEFALAIYVLLCKILRYDSNYVLFRNFDSVLRYDQVTKDNNDVICVTFAIIYYKLLKEFGFDVNLSGDFLTHMKVELRIGTMMLEADGTMFGFDDVDSNEYKISDIGNVKFGLSLKGFNLVRKYYVDLEYVKYNQKRLDEAISNVTRLLYDDKSSAICISNLLYNGLIEIRKIRKKNKILTGEEIDYRINLLNKIYERKIEGLECENKQFLAKFKHKIFGDLKSAELKDIILYSYENDQIRLYSLYVVSFGNQVLCYLENENGLSYLEMERLLEEINDKHLEFKDESDRRFINLFFSSDKKLIK